jgi:hypothetical protein
MDLLPLHLGQNSMETSVNICKTRRRDNPEESNFHNAYLEKAKYHIFALLPEKNI